MESILTVIESAIVEKLRTAFQGLDVRSFPSNLKEYQFKNPRGGVFVVYHGSNYEKPKSLGILTQERITKWQIVILSRDLNSHTGSYSMLDKTIHCLLGWQPPHCKPMILENDGFTHQEDGIWQYAMTFSASSMTIQNLETSDEPLLTQVRYEEKMNG